MVALLAFSPDQVSKVTGLSRRQLRYWDETGFFRPRYAAEQRRFGRMYSFKDVVGLQTIAQLRDRLPLQELRKIGSWLMERYEEPWAELRLFVVGKRVAFEEPSGDRTVAGSGQGVLPICLADVAHQTEQAADELVGRASEQLGRVVRNRYVQHNAWVLDGTRIPTSAIYDFYEAGYQPAEILKEYPRLTPADISAAIEFEQNRTLKAG
jgi:uncharacterized protein (DUF433 family)